MSEAVRNFFNGLLTGTLSKVPLGEYPIPNESITPEVLFGVFTSNYSQKLGEKLKLNVLATVNFEDFEYDGVKMSDKIGEEHKTAKLGVLRIQ